MDRCNICYDNYNTTTNLPRLLECGHIFCEECIIKEKNDNDKNIVISVSLI